VHGCETHLGLPALAPAASRRGLPGPPQASGLPWPGSLIDGPGSSRARAMPGTRSPTRWSSSRTRRCQSGSCSAGLRECPSSCGSACGCGPMGDEALSTAAESGTTARKVAPPVPQSRLQNRHSSSKSPEPAQRHLARCRVMTEGSQGSCRPISGCSSRLSCQSTHPAVCQLHRIPESPIFRVRRPQDFAEQHEVLDQLLQ
jgi:hypothetical protein